MYATIRQCDGADVHVAKFISAHPWIPSFENDCEQGKIKEAKGCSDVVLFLFVT